MRTLVLNMMNRYGWILIVAVIFFISPAGAFAQPVRVLVNAAESVSQEFEFTVDIENAVDLDSGQLDLDFDPEAIEILDVKEGNLAGNRVPIDLWAAIKPGRVRLLFNFPGVQAISGNGQIATISARAVGKTGDIAAIKINKGLLVDKNADQIPAAWISAEVKIQKIAPKSDINTALSSSEDFGAETGSKGVAISTPMALVGLALLVAVPALFMVLFRRKRN